MKRAMLPEHVESHEIRRERDLTIEYLKSVERWMINDHYGTALFYLRDYIAALEAKQAYFQEDVECGKKG